MVLELFEGEYVLISKIKFDIKLKINGHCLNPYLTSEPSAPTGTMNLHLPEEVMSVSPSPH